MHTLVIQPEKTAQRAAAPLRLQRKKTDDRALVLGPYAERVIFLRILAEDLRDLLIGCPVCPEIVFRIILAAATALDSRGPVARGLNQFFRLPPESDSKNAVTMAARTYGILSSLIFASSLNGRSVPS